MYHSIRFLKTFVKTVTGDHPDNVVFSGYLSGPVLEGVYYGADAFFFPSKEETEGIVVLETLASYQQVILRDIPVFDPWIEDGVNCYKGKSVDDVVQQRLPNLKSAGRSVAEARSLSIIGKQLRHVYELLLSTEVMN